MEVTFDDPRLKRLCESEKELRKQCGVLRAKKIQTRLADLRAAETLADMRMLPGHCHELTADRAGQLSLDLDQPYRLLFRPVVETRPARAAALTGRRSRQWSCCR
ncbi:MAG: type II toxin-antitoxin system RelE/ParE family toxin [Streptosporangiaceae bacterium]